MSHLPKAPVRFIEGNQDLLKSQDAGSAGQRKGGTDYSLDVDYAQVDPGVNHNYRTPPDRMDGNPVFRRYINGVLDFEYAKHKVIDAIHRAKTTGSDTLNSVEKMSLSVLFPSSFAFVDSSMMSSVMSTQLRISPEEAMRVRQMVAEHLAAEMNWNAGRGGGSVPGREHTYRP